MATYDELIQQAYEISQRPLDQFNLQDILDITDALEAARHDVQTEIDLAVNQSTKQVTATRKHLVEAEQQTASIRARYNQVVRVQNPPSKAIVPPTYQLKVLKEDAQGRSPVPVPYRVNIEGGQKVKVKTLGTSKSQQLTS